MQKRWFIALGVAALGGLSLVFASSESMSGGGMSLYEKIGGQTGVTTVIDNFLGNVGGDDRVNVRFVNTDMDVFRGHMIDQVCEVTGGPCKYMGKTMLEAHQGMGITDEEFGIIAGHFAAAMDSAGVGKKEHDTIMGVLAGMHDDIVGH